MLERSTESGDASFVQINGIGVEVQHGGVRGNTGPGRSDSSQDTFPDSLDRSSGITEQGSRENQEGKTENRDHDTEQGQPDQQQRLSYTGSAQRSAAVGATVRLVGYLLMTIAAFDELHKDASDLWLAVFGTENQRLGCWVMVLT